jgi:GAF domain-containing protein
MADPDSAHRGHTSSGEGLDAGLARDLSELAREMQAQEDPAALLDLLVHAALAEIDGADHAGIMLMIKGTARTVAKTSDLVEAMDGLQRDAGDGPCLTSLRDHLTVRSNDLTDESRWRRFSRGAVQLGVQSILALQLFVQEDNLGALNLYAERPNAFDDEAENIGLLFASHAAVAVIDARKIENLEVALATRDVIGQAKGILMERFKVDASQAFSMLVLVSRHTHRKLNAVAERLATTGELPDVRNRPAR